MWVTAVALQSLQC